MEKIISYSIARRIGYARRNGWFKTVPIFGFNIPWIPTDHDIHVHNIWKDLKKKPRR